MTTMTRMMICLLGLLGLFKCLLGLVMLTHVDDMFGVVPLVGGIAAIAYAVKIVFDETSGKK